VLEACLPSAETASVSLPDILPITRATSTLTVATSWQLNRFQPKGTPNITETTTVDTISIITTITTQIAE
jgi:hypothetical protein